MAIRPIAADMFDITDCIAVITGGGSGIGSMIAKALAANGAKVYILGRRLEVLEKAAKEMVRDSVLWTQPADADEMHRKAM